MNKFTSLLRPYKPWIIPFLWVFFTTSIFIEIIFIIGAADNNKNYWTARFRTENTMLEMFAEDIWLHGRSTFKTEFNPKSCSLTAKDKWLVRWTEVKCVAEDMQGQHWQYKVLYSDNYTLLFFLPFIVNYSQPIRLFEKVK